MQMASDQSVAVELEQEQMTNAPAPLHTLEEWHKALEHAGSFSSLTQHCPALAALMQQRCTQHTALLAQLAARTTLSSPP